MTVPLLKRYYATPFNAATQIDALDVFLGDGLEDTFPLVYKNGLQVGGVSQKNTTLLPRFNDEFMVDGDDIIFQTIPGAGDVLIVPGLTALSFPVSDQNDALGRTKELSFYVADVQTIHLYKYKLVPGQAGIRISAADQYVGGAFSTWFRFAPALPSGLVGTYLAPGASLYTGNLDAASQLNGAAASLDPTITVDDGSVFTEGDFLQIDTGLGSQETLKISTIAGNVLTVPAGVAVAHADNAYVLACGRKFFVEVTVPLDAAGGVPYNFFDVSLDTYVRITAR